MKVLIVDDSMTQRKMISEVIAKIGFKGGFLEASDGNEAIDQLGKNFRDICLVVTDLNMPNLSGDKFIEAVAKVPPLAKVPVVVVSIEGTQEKIDSIYAKHPGLAGYVKKPFTADELKAAISKFLK
ncbi:MAG: response regulator [Candidatus Omnitrophica bacterium]|nr:response regulator [Candidatus Omnitrophota bacterium]MDD5671082.1 response regulator [Candidatus Omnitrophota bacterium]